MKELNEKIIEIQETLKAPKGQFNNFGKYKYRSCEDILEAIKPLLSEHNLLQTISDELINIGDRYYIKATVKVSDGENELSVSSYAREAETKKGMDVSQITGTASSYARKYALNGLWLIDDTKDADTMENKSNPILKPDTKRWNKGVHALASGATTLDNVKDRYNISDKNLERLEAEYKQVAEDAHAS